MSQKLHQQSESNNSSTKGEQAFKKNSSSSVSGNSFQASNSLPPTSLEPEWLSQSKKNPESENSLPVQEKKKISRFSKQQILDLYQPSDIKQLLSNFEEAPNFFFLSVSSLVPVNNLPTEQQEEFNTKLLNKPRPPLSNNRGEISLSTSGEFSRPSSSSSPSRGRGGIIHRGGRGRYEGGGNKPEVTRLSSSDNWSSDRSSRSQTSTPNYKDSGNYRRRVSSGSSWRNENSEGQSSSKSNMWMYQDPSGNIQGPFSDQEMQTWYEDGYFDQSLQLRRTYQEEYSSLGSLIENNNGISPFLSTYYTSDRYPKKPRDMSGSWRSKSQSDEFQKQDTQEKDKEKGKEKENENENFSEMKKLRDFEDIEEREETKVFEDEISNISNAKPNSSTSNPFVLLDKERELESSYIPPSMMLQTQQPKSIPSKPISLLSNVNEPWSSGSTNSAFNLSSSPSLWNPAIINENPNNKEQILTSPFLSTPSSHTQQSNFSPNQLNYSSEFGPNSLPINFSLLGTTNSSNAPMHQPLNPIESQPLTRKEGVFVLDSSGAFVQVQSKSTFPPQESTKQYWNTNPENTSSPIFSQNQPIYPPYSLQETNVLPKSHPMHMDPHMYVQQYSQFQQIQQYPQYQQYLQYQQLQQQHQYINQPPQSFQPPLNQNIQPASSFWNVPVQQQEPNSPNFGPTESETSFLEPLHPSESSFKSPSNLSEPISSEISPQNTKSNKGEPLTFKKFSEPSVKSNPKTNLEEEKSTSNQEIMNNPKFITSSSQEPPKPQFQWGKPVEPSKKESLSLRAIQEQEMQERARLNALPKPEPEKKPVSVPQPWSKWNTPMEGSKTPSLKEIQEQELKRKSTLGEKEESKHKESTVSSSISELGGSVWGKSKPIQSVPNPQEFPKLSSGPKPSESTPKKKQEEQPKNSSNAQSQKTTNQQASPSSSKVQTPPQQQQTKSKTTESSEKGKKKKK